MTKFRLSILTMVICIIFIFGISRLTFADGSSVSTQSVVVPSADNAASEDDQNKQNGFDPGFPEVDPTGIFQYQFPINLPPIASVIQN